MLEVCIRPTNIIAKVFGTKTDKPVNGLFTIREMDTYQMKIFKALSVGILASGLLFGATACSPENETNKGTGVEQSVQSETQAKTEIATNVNSLLDYLSKEENLDKLANAGMDVDENATDDEIAKQVKASSPEAFKYFDAYDTQTIANSYAMMAEIAMATSLGNDVERSVSEDAVTIDGDTAKVDGSKMKTVVDGETMPEADSSAPAEERESDFIDFVKKNGKWLVKAPMIDLNS